MKIKKWLTGAVLSLCLLMNTLAMPAASAGTLGDMVAERFPSISALQEKLGNKDSLRESLQYLENWQEYVDKGIEKLNELSDTLKEKGMTLALDHFSGKINDYVNENAPFKIEEGYETKIVPVVTGGSKGYIGAAQICGPKEHPVSGADRHGKTNQPGKRAPCTGRRRQRPAGSWLPGMN